MSDVTIKPLSVPEAIRPEDAEGRTAGSFFADALVENGIAPEDNDVLVVSSKVVSFFEGGLICLADVRPSWKARFLGRAFEKDPRKMQVLMETGRVLLAIPVKRIMRIPSVRQMMMERTANPEAMLAGYTRLNGYTFIVPAHAAYLDEAGIDYTNSPEGYITVLPPDPCATAREIRDELRNRFGVELAVIIADTVTSVGRIGSQDVAIGYAGIDPMTRETFSDDLFGVPRSGGIDIVIDSIAGLAGLVMGQTIELTPAALVRGVDHAPERPEDVGRGMGVLGYPPRAMGQMTLHVLIATAWFRILNLLSLQRWPKKTRSV